MTMIWDTDELLFAVAQELEPTELATMCRINSRTWRAAARLIWRSSNLKNLVQLFKAPRLASRRSRIPTSPLIDDRYWNRFQLYAPFVRNLVVRIDRGTPWLYKSLFGSPHFKFSGLASVYLEIADQPPGRIIETLLQPTVRRVNIIFLGGYIPKLVDVHMLGEALAERLPHLASISLTMAQQALFQIWESSVPAANDMLVEFFTRQVAMQKMALSTSGYTPLRSSGIQSLSLKSNITSLVLDGIDFNLVDRPSFSGFRSLETVQLRGTATEIPFVLHAISSEFLRTVRLDLFTILADGLDQTLLSLHDVPALFRITELIIRAEDVVWSRLIDMITQYPQLIKVSVINRACRESLTDNDIQAVAQVWPKILYLTLLDRNSARSCATLSSLHFFAQHCPELRQLAIQVGDVEIDDVVITLSSKCLVELDLDDSFLGDQKSAVVKFLRRMWPNLPMDFNPSGMKRVSQRGWHNFG